MCPDTLQDESERKRGEMYEKENSKAYSVGAGCHDGAGRLWRQRRQYLPAAERLSR